MLAPRGHLMDTLMLAQNSTASQACKACYKLQVTDPGAMGCLRSRVTSKYSSVFPLKTTWALLESKGITGAWREAGPRLSRQTHSRASSIFLLSPEQPETWRGLSRAPSPSYC